MKKLKCIIVDDEPKAIKSLTWELENMDRRLEILETTTNPKKALIIIEELKPDIVFLDIEMPGLDGFSLLELLDYRDFHVVFTTAYNQYAVKAFRYNAIDYLLKPIDQDELVETINKITNSLDNQVTSSDFERIKAMMHERSPRKIPIHSASDVVLVSLEDIVYCHSEGNYTTLYTTTSSHLLSKNLKNAELLINSRDFLRVHNSYLVNSRYVARFSKSNGGELFLTNEVIIPVSRQRKKEVLERLISQ